MDLSQCQRDILGETPIDLADEAQRQMELLVILPASPRNAAHDRAQRRADRWRRTECDEQAMHCAIIAVDLALSASRVALPDSLEKPGESDDIPVIRPLAGKRSFFAMANWSDPQPNATAFSHADVRTAAYDAGLRRYMLSVYNYMSSAVLLSGLVAFFFAMGGENSPAAHILL